MDLFWASLAPLNCIQHLRACIKALSIIFWQVPVLYSSAPAELPSQPLLEKLMKELHHQLDLRLFNLDIIREHGTRDPFYVIDINCLPGTGKCQCMSIFTDSLLSFVQNQYMEKST